MEGFPISRRSFLTGSSVGLGTLLVGSGTAFGKPAGRYIVGTSSPAATRAAKQAADRVTRELDFGDIGSAVAGAFPAAALDGLRRRPDVRYIEADGRMEAISIDSSDSEVPWGVDRVDAEKAHASGATGDGADVAILDTGIDSNHPDLEGNFGVGKAFVSANGSYAKPWDDDNGHGTHCAGTADAVDNGSGVVGTSTQATLHAVKVLDKDGSGYYSDVAAGLEYVADEGWHVASMSLGGPKSQTIRDACQYAYDRDVLIVAAAGNDGTDVENSAPATYSTVMAISATDDRDRLASFSNYGSDIELAAPGVSIYSTYPGGEYRTYSGTSMACPHVSGAAGALFAQDYTRDEARQRLKDTAEDIGLSSSKQGSGLLDVEAAVSGSVDASPGVSWITPADGETVSGTITVQIDASDSEDSDDTLDVTYSVDSGSSQSTAYNSTSGYYEDSWDTSTVADGDHALEATVTDSAGNTSTAAISVTTENTDDAPAVSWVNPAGGDTVGDTVTVQLDASDDRDSGTDLTVEWQIDDGTWQTASYNSTSGYYEDDWDTTAVADGDHVLDAHVTDTGGNTSAETSSTVTVDNTTSSPSGTIDEATVTEVNSRNPHAEFNVPWSATGDTLDTVELTLTQTSPAGGTEDSVTIDVGGSSADGTTELMAKHDDGRGYTYDVTITVTNTNGATGGETDLITEDGR